MSYFTQMAGLAYHNFVSAATGIALAIAFIRGIAQKEKDTIGNFWVDMVRCVLWVLLPVCLIGSLVLVSQGVVQNLRPYDKVAVIDPQTTTASGADGKPQTQVVAEQVIAQGGGVAGNHQGVRHQRRRILQRQQRASFGTRRRSRTSSKWSASLPSRRLTYTLGDMTGSRRHGWAVWARWLFLAGVTTALAEAGAIRSSLPSEPTNPYERRRAATWRAGVPVRDCKLSAVRDSDH
jgi:K+-transporting ATPase ATPase A chain